jgi:hypothetical protein
MKKILRSLILICLSSSSAYATEIVQQFKDPSFTANGWSTQMFSVYQTEQTAKQAIVNQAAADKAAADAAAQNTPLAKFLNLFQSQVYAQLATQLSNNLFQNNCKDSTGSAISGCTNPTTGSFNLSGNTITWQNMGSNVKLTVLDATGNLTVVTVPISQFAF